MHVWGSKIKFLRRCWGEGAEGVPLAVEPIEDRAQGMVLMSQKELTLATNDGG